MILITDSNPMMELGMCQFNMDEHVSTNQLIVGCGFNSRSIRY